MSAALFESIPLRGLDAASAERVRAGGQVRSLEPAEVLYRVGEDADALFVVVRGRLQEDSGGRVRVLGAGETAGAEAMLGLPRRAEVRADGPAEVFEVSAALLERAWTRAGGRLAMQHERRRLERSALDDALRSTEGLADLDEAARGILLDGASLQSWTPGATLQHAGDAAADALMVLDGVVHAIDEDGTVAHVALRGDLLGVDAARAEGRWTRTLVAAGHVRTVAIPGAVLRRVVASTPARTEARDAARGDIIALLRAGAAELPDLDRLERARSLLVLDEDRCVRCGHCTWSCAATHGGEPRMARVGPRVTARMGGEDARSAPWRLAQACQHCSAPACLGECPTAAISRDAAGTVLIDPSLCTGCGACAKACPWDAIEMSPRPEGVAMPLGDSPFPLLASKCDLCAGGAGPACVQACPTDAIARVQPGRDFVEVSALLGTRARPAAARGPRWGGWVATVLASVALLLGAWGAAQHQHGWIAGAGPGWVAGVLGACAVVLSAAHGVRKRLLGRWRRWTGPMRPWVLGHAVLGSVALAGAWAHTGGHAQGRPAVLAGAFIGCVGLGLLGVFAYAVLPAVLTRLEAGEVSARPLEDQLLQDVGGRAEALKQLAAKVLVPYARQRGGGLLLLLSGRSLAQEQAVVLARLQDRLGADRLARIEGVEGVVRTVVAIRAARVRPWVHRLLRLWLAPHIVLAVVAIALLGLHVVTGGA